MPHLGAQGEPRLPEPLTILGQQVAVELRPGPTPRPGRDAASLMAALVAMADEINALDWDEDQTLGFRSIRKIVLFSRQVQNYGWLMRRSGCDVARGVFYWSIREFAGHPDPKVHANMLFHDGWHVVQHLRDGGYPKSEAEQVEREIDAIDRQVVVARRLGCEEHKAVFLEDFGADRERIAARIREGVRRAKRAPSRRRLRPAAPPRA